MLGNLEIVSDLEWDRCKLLRKTPKSVASRYYQLLSGHAAIGSYLKDKIHKTRTTSAGGAVDKNGRPDDTYLLSAELGCYILENVEGNWEGTWVEAPKGTCN